MPAEPPSAITVACPDCGEETLHTVLKGTMGTRGEHVTLDATVQCTECSRVHHAVVRQAKDVEVPVVVSHGNQSRRTRIALPGDEDVSVGEAFIVDGVNCKVTGIEAKDTRWVDDAHVKDVLTLWVKEFEELPVGFAINLGHKTITKTLPSPPEREFTVGEEFVFGRLRVTVHAIKTEDRLLKRGTAEAGEIVRVFASPTPLGTSNPRPDKKSREQMRLKEERRHMRDQE
jgi:uncharacterized Zn finger protein